jgi:apolipoprotein N-acyltransferase
MGRFALYLALALATSALYAAAFPPLALWPLGWIALAPLCGLCARVSPGRAALYGLFSGSVAGALVSPWLPGMVGDYFEARGALVWLASLAAWTLCGGVYVAAFAAWLSLALTRGPVAPLLVGAAWWLCELARAHGLVANPWALLGTSQMEWPPAAQIADLAGPYGVGALLAATGAAVASASDTGLRGARPRAALGALTCVVAAQLAYGAWHLRTQGASTPPLRVALVQGAIPRAQRFDAAHLEANLEGHLALTREAAAGGAQLVAWPELALDFYVQRDLALRARLTESTRALGVELLAGGLGGRIENGRARSTNSVYLLRDGSFVASYDKLRPMPFSEAHPFGGWLTSEPDPILAADSLRLLPARVAQVGVATCNEAMHPEFTRELARAGAEVILNPSNDGWFGSRSAARAQLRAVSMRAIETRRYLLRPTANGYTALVDPQGRVVAEAPYGVGAVVGGEAVPGSLTTVYTRFGDTVALLPLAFVVGDGALRWRRPRREAPR